MSDIMSDLLSDVIEYLISDVQCQLSRHFPHQMSIKVTLQMSWIYFVLKTSRDLDIAVIYILAFKQSLRMNVSVKPLTFKLIVHYVPLLQPSCYVVMSKA